MVENEFRRIDEAIADRTTGLFVVHGNTGTGKTTLMREIARRASVIHERMITSIENASLHPTMRPEALTAMLLRGRRNPPAIVFGEIREEVDAERAVHMARHMPVVAEMHDTRFERVRERLVWLGASAADVDEVLIGQVSLDREDTHAASLPDGAVPVLWFETSEGRRITIAVPAIPDQPHSDSKITVKD